MAYIIPRLFCLSLLLCLFSFGCAAPTDFCESDAQCKNGEICNTVSNTCIPNNNTTNNNNNSDTDSGTPPERTPPPTGKCDIKPFNEADVQDNGGEKVELDQADTAFFQMLYKIYYTSQNCHDQVWGGGYQMHKIPTYLVNIGTGEPGTKAGKKGFLINHPSPPAGSKLIDAKLVNGIPNVYLYNDAANRIESPGFEFAFTVGSAKVYAFEYGSGEQNNPTNDLSTFALFVHEGFHRVQDNEEKWEYPNGIQETAGYPLTTDMVALILLEDAALFDGVTGSNGADETLKIWYAARKERIRIDSSPNKLIQNLDNFQEWLEGTAMYAESAYTKLLGTSYPDSSPNSIPGRIKFFGTLGSSESRQDLIDSLGARYYGTGAGVGLLLDKLDDSGWKDQIRKGKTFYDIVASRYSSLGDTDLKQILDQAKQKYDYNGAILTRAKDYAARK